MAGRLIRAQVVIKSKSGLPKDQFVNTFTLLEHDTPAGDLDDVLVAIAEAYSLPQTIGGQARSHIGFHFSSEVAQSGHEVKAYNLDEPAPRVPVATLGFGLPANPASAGFPAEVALCVSGRATKVSGTIDARRRGRVYIGPLKASDVVLEASTNKPRPSVALKDDCLWGVIGIAQRANTAGWLLGTTSSQGAPGNFVPWSEFWVDDAFDTQRRRGAQVTAKTLQPITQLALAA